MDKIVKSLTLDNWDVQGNKLRGDLGHFGLLIEIQGFDKEKLKDFNELHFEEEGIGFLLTVYSFTEIKRTFCAFSSLEQAVFFVNGYLVNCETISDVDEMYNTYRQSEANLNKKGYIS